MTTQCFWEILDALPGLTAAKAEWQRLLGDQFDACACYLRPTGGIAQSLPRSNEPSYRIVYHGPDDYVGVCPTGGPTITVTKSDITLYELHQRKLGDAIIDVLNLEKQFHTADGVADVWMLGCANQHGKMRHPVFMAFRIEESEYRVITLALGMLHPKGFIFISPTGQPRSGTPGSIFSMNKLFGIAADGTLVPNWNGDTWLADAPVPYQEPIKPDWPDPAKNTMAMVWTTKDGSFWIRTKRNDQKESKAKFALGAGGSPVKQSQLLRLLAFQYPKPVSISEVLEQVYPDETVEVRSGQAVLNPLLKKCRTLFSNLRSKLEKSGINPRIIPSLSVDSDKSTNVVLQVTHVRYMDDHGLDDADKASL